VGSLLGASPRVHDPDLLRYLFALTYRLDRRGIDECPSSSGRVASGATVLFTAVELSGLLVPVDAGLAAAPAPRAFDECSRIVFST